MNRPTDPTTPRPDLPGLLPNRACRPCVRIKAKCVPLTGSEQLTCERCSRLGKQCTTPAPAPRRGPCRQGSSNPERQPNARPRTSNTPHARQLSNTPHSPDQSPSTYVRPHGALPVEAIQQPTPISLSNPPYTPTGVHHGCIATDSAPSVQEYFHKGRTQVAGSAFDISPEIGHVFVQSNHEHLYNQFRTRMSSHLPFMVLSDEASVMRKERPFTYVACVMAAAHNDPAFQYRVSRDIFRYIGEHMLLCGEKSLDILQGLLIMITWYHVYTHSNPQLMNILHLAQALLVDLGLNRPPGTGLFAIKLSNDGIKMMHGVQLDAHKHSLEEHRACLAMYHVCFKLSVCFRRLDPMCWTEHLDECCQNLQDAAERASDGYAVALVRLDRLVDRYTSIDGGHQTLTMAIPAYVKLFSDDIEAFKQNLSPQLRNDASMNAQIQTARLCLFERVINSAASVSTHKVEALHSCLLGVVEYFDSLIAQSTDTIPYLPFIFWSTIAHAFDILAKLSFIEVEHWDLDYVRNNPGFAIVSDRIIHKFREVLSAEESRHPTKPDIRFKIFINRIEQFKKWYLSRLELESRSRSQRSEEETEVLGTFNDPLFGSHLGDFADMLWQNLTPDWAYLDNAFNMSQD